MAPTPRRQNPQSQPLTTLLRKICKDYPAGAGVLRELLQNADDAGASKLEFVLDTNSHPTAPLIKDGLAEYQGPALLAYNDSIFTEVDWKSISSIGDSEKLQNKIATGKYGLGFNSIYNWTDGPSVLSGDTLLLLDPHHSWSSGYDPPGGPEFDFTADSNDEAMQNQLQPFSCIVESWSEPFNGTVIRIPLRSATQAKTSKIRSAETTTEDIQDTMTSFADEMGTFGLLFLKSVRRIVFKVDGRILNTVDISSDSDLTRPRLYLENLVAREVSNSTNRQSENNDEKIYHEVVVTRNLFDVVSTKRYGVFHLMRYQNVDVELAKWAKNEKLFPWVAVATRVDEEGESDEPETGRLFSVLPLSVTTGLKVQVHGSFSLSADRSRVHGLEDSGVYDKNPEKWNKFLFDSMVPEAWATLYSHICRHHSERRFQFYESTNQSKNQLWHNMNTKIFEVVCQKNLEIWPSFETYTNCERAVFISDGTKTNLVDAVKVMKVPTVIVKDDMLQLVKAKLPHRILCPKLLFGLVATVKEWPSESEDTNSALLEYFFPHISIQELSTLPIFPFEDGEYRNLTMKTFVHRDPLEKELFDKSKDCNLDLARIPANVCDAIRNEAQKTNLEPICFRSEANVRDYFLRYVANEDADVISPNDETEAFVQKIWQWMKFHVRSASSLKELGCLWLLPLQSGGIRRLVPRSKGFYATAFDHGGAYEVAQSLLNLDPDLLQRIVSNRLFDDATLRWLLPFVTNPCFDLGNGDTFQGLAVFLKDSAHVFAEMSDCELGDCHRVLKDKYLDRTRNAREKELLKSIPLFPEIFWDNNNGFGSPYRRLANLSGSKTFSGLRTLIPLPPVEGQGLIDATNEEMFSLLTKTKLANCLDEVVIIGKLVLPAAEAGLYDYVAARHRITAAEAIFRNFYRISSEAQTLVPKLSIVCKARTASTQPIKFAPCEEMIDPENRKLKDLFFEDEILWPDSTFLNKFPGILKECGLAEVLNETLASQRIKAYASAAYDLDLIEPRVKSLLSLQISGEQTWRTEFIELVHSSKWLPARKSQENISLYKVSECRDSRWKAVAGHVMPIMQFEIDQSWTKIFNWTQLSSDLLITQLEASIVHQEWSSIDATLRELNRRDNIAKHKDSLRKLNFVRNSEGALINPLAACRRGAENLSPYLSNVDSGLWVKYPKILKMVEIPDSPDLTRLTNLLDNLAVSGALNPLQLNIAVAVAALWTEKSFDDSELRLPDTSGLLVPLRELVDEDVPYPTNCNRPVLHEKVPKSLAKKLGIEPVSSLIKKQILSILDEEDEFDQFEDVIDGIRDTLGRYSVQSTFHEYIANADDCGNDDDCYKANGCGKPDDCGKAADCSKATTVNIMFDSNTYEQDNLLTTELEKYQGPSLIIHNDGIFNDADFDGFKHVGRGSKRDNPETIGKFGRGAQTMFHWTDVPMILSGEFLLILEYVALNRASPS